VALFQLGEADERVVLGLPVRIWELPMETGRC
jgi:hypothetical protein